MKKVSLLLFFYTLLFTNTSFAQTTVEIVNPPRPSIKFKWLVYIEHRTTINSAQHDESFHSDYIFLDEYEKEEHNLVIKGTYELCTNLYNKMRENPTTGLDCILSENPDSFLSPHPLWFPERDQDASGPDLKFFLITEAPKPKVPKRTEPEPEQKVRIKPVPEPQEAEVVFE